MLSPYQPSVTAVTWHVCWRAAAGLEPFLYPPLAMLIRSRLIQAHQGHGRTLVAFQILPCEIHVVSHLTVPDTPSRLARSIGTIVARWVRQFRPLRSPVFAAPYRARIMASSEELVCELRLLAWRPVSLHLCRSPTHFTHGAVRVALGLSVPDGFDPKPLLSLFSPNLPAARAGLRRLLARPPDTDEVHAWELQRGLVLAIGPTGALPVGGGTPASGAASLLAAARPRGLTGALAILETWIKVRLGLPSGDDLRMARGALGARARALVACLAVRHRLCSAAEVARRYGRARSTLCEPDVRLSTSCGRSGGTVHRAGAGDCRDARAGKAWTGWRGAGRGGRRDRQPPWSGHSCEGGLGTQAPWAFALVSTADHSLHGTGASDGT